MKLWQYAIRKMGLLDEDFLQRRLARSLLFERATAINYRPIEGFGTNASFEVIFQNQNILAFLRAIYHNFFSKIATLLCHIIGVSQVPGRVHVGLRDSIAKRGLLRSK